MNLREPLPTSPERGAPMNPEKGLAEATGEERGAAGRLGGSA
jgi:hypothetical protein